MKKAINIGIIVLFLIAICAVEQVLSTNYLKDVETRVDKIYETFASLEDIRNTKLISEMSELENFWTRKESVLCNFVNHKDIEEIGVEINKLHSAITQNDKNQFAQSLNLIKFYLDAYTHVLGISVQNAF